MGTITTRRRADGTEAHTAQIRIRLGGRLVHNEAQTFDRKPAARAWLARREDELAKPGALAAAQVADPTLDAVIGEYLQSAKRDYGDTKKQVLRVIRSSDIGKMNCGEIKSQHIVKFAQSLNVKPQTVANYLAHLAAVFAVARPMWGYPLDKAAMDDARAVCKRMGITTRSRERDRRPALDELDQLLEHFTAQRIKAPAASPMVDLLLFAMFSTRRQEEITRLAWEDLNEARSDIIVRDMKHPGEKIGNDVRVTLPPEALRIILRQPTRAKGGTIFPFNAESISSSFTRACKILAISDLHFHDLRHEGVSRLFELGWTIPQVATVSGHRTWTSLKRYSHIDQFGDKYATWPWMQRADLRPPA